MVTERTRLILRVLLVAAMGSLAAAQDNPTVSTSTQANPTISPRDVLKITVWPAEAMSRTYTVDPGGEIDFPEVGRITASGLTARQLEDLLIKRLVDGGILLSPRITVELEQKPTKTIIVAGDGVNRPGQIPFAGELRIHEALLLAGSTTFDAAEEAIVVRRGPDPEEPEVLHVNLRELQGPNVAEHNILLQDGDNVFVHKAAQVFITGYVASAGAYPVRPGMTVDQALALAGGPSTLGATNRITIRRKNDKGELEEIRVQLTDPVQPGDTIHVPRRRL
jgi:polysaccharide export outer membrane protein